MDEFLMVDLSRLLLDNPVNVMNELASRYHRPPLPSGVLPLALLVTHLASASHLRPTRSRQGHRPGEGGRQ
jgi:hypothetical protein